MVSSEKVAHDAQEITRVLTLALQQRKQASAAPSPSANIFTPDVGYGALAGGLGVGGLTSLIDTLRGKKFSLGDMLMGGVSGALAGGGLGYAAQEGNGNILTGVKNMYDFASGTKKPGYTDKNVVYPTGAMQKLKQSLNTSTPGDRLAGTAGGIALGVGKAAVPPAVGYVGGKWVGQRLKLNAKKIEEASGVNTPESLNQLIHRRKYMAMAQKRVDEYNDDVVWHNAKLRAIDPNAPPLPTKPPVFSPDASEESVHNTLKNLLDDQDITPYVEEAENYADATKGALRENPWFARIGMGAGAIYSAGNILRNWFNPSSATANLNRVVSNASR